MLRVMILVMVVANASLTPRSTSLARAASAAIKPSSQSLGVVLEGAWDTHPETRAAATRPAAATITTCALQAGPRRSTGVTVVLSGSAAASTHWADIISSLGVVPAHRHPGIGKEGHAGHHPAILCDDGGSCSDDGSCHSWKGWWCHWCSWTYDAGGAKECYSDTVVHDDIIVELKSK